MCRLALYTGPARPLSALLYEPAHSLEEQAYRPREMQHAVVNVDGTGVAWFRDGDVEPLRYVTMQPPWSDANLPDLARRFEGHTIVAAVRSATPGMGFSSASVAPFVRDGVVFSHNGWVGGFRRDVGPELMRRLPDDLLGALPALTDSTVLFQTVLRHRAEGAGLAQAVEATLAEVTKLVTRGGEQATLNLVATDGVEHVASRYSIGLPGNSLYLLVDGPRWAGARVIASEPFDDDPWSAVPDGSLVHLTADTQTVRPLALEDTP